MRVGWVSHQWPSADDAPARPGLLPGRFAGGAEMLQDAMRGRLSGDVTFVPVDTRDRSRTLSERLEGCDRVVVAAAELLTPEDMATLLPLGPLVWQMSSAQPWMAPLFQAARPMVWASEQMRGWFPWAPDGVVCSGWFDTSDVPRGVEKDGTALWAARDHPQKGRVEARMWARQRGIELVELTGVPRPQVLEAMGRASYFVLLAKGFDPCPTTVIEAELAGCEIVTNRMVGRLPVSGAAAVQEWIDSLPERFLGWLSG